MPKSIVTPDFLRNLCIKSEVKLKLEGWHQSLCKGGENIADNIKDYNLKVETAYATLSILEEFNPDIRDLKQYAKELNENTVREAYYGEILETAETQYEYLKAEYENWYAESAKSLRHELEVEETDRVLVLARKSNEENLKITGLKPRDITDRMVDNEVKTMPGYVEWQKKLTDCKEIMNRIEVIYKAFIHRKDTLINAGSMIKEELKATKNYPG